MPGIFISYRREDCAGHAGRLYDTLRPHCSPLFMDIDTLKPGEDFVEAIEKAIDSCEALLVLIGRQWLTSTNVQGQRRLEDPNDFVRQEVEAALARNIRVIPVLVQGATMPQSQHLPETLGKLARRQAHEITDSRWQYDVERLIQSLKNVSGGVGTQTNKEHELIRVFTKESEQARKEEREYDSPGTPVADREATFLERLRKKANKERAEVRQKDEAERLRKLRDQKILADGAQQFKHLKNAFEKILRTVHDELPEGTQRLKLTGRDRRIRIKYKRCTLSVEEETKEQTGDRKVVLTYTWTRQKLDKSSSRYKLEFDPEHLFCWEKDYSKFAHEEVALNAIDQLISWGEI